MTGGYMRTPQYGITATCFFVMMIFIGTGCRKQVSTLHDETPVKPDTTFRQPVSFSDVDTSDNASFRDAQLAEELARKAREALQPVYFEYNSYTLNPEALLRLTAAASFLKENPSMRILVQGHCDERGSSEYNMGLGENRSKVIREYLVNYGIEQIRIEITSMGKEQPALPGCGFDETCHARNRRSEFKPLAR
jgi:peptidoglycan-associated lipoprotein